MKIRLQGLKDQPHYKVKKCWVVKKTFLVCEYHAKGNHDEVNRLEMDVIVN